MLKAGGLVNFEVKYSRRQRDVLKLVVAGKAPKEIAAELEISSKTVYRRIRAMCKAAAVHSPAELMVWALQHPEAFERDAQCEPGLHPIGCLCPAAYCVATRQPAA
jgi:DNA-binding CsgD family transcriptional regulator